MEVEPLLERLMQRCDVMPEHRYLVEGLDAVCRRDDIDLVVVNEDEGEPLLMALGRDRLYLVESVPGQFTTTSRVAARVSLVDITRAEVLSQSDGEAGGCWLLLETPFRKLNIPLSAHAVEDARQLADRLAGRGGKLEVHLRQLAVLYEQGVLNDEEFSNSKSRLLSS